MTRTIKVNITRTTPAVVTSTVTRPPAAAVVVGTQVTRGAPGIDGEDGAPGAQGPPGESSAEAMNLHLLDPTPHSPYDDMPSLTLLFENQLI